jgi:hypothetical protein
MRLERAELIRPKFCHFIEPGPELLQRVSAQTIDAHARVLRQAVFLHETARA